MKIIFFSNYINHHQVGVADQLYQLAQGNYTFVETTPMPEFRVKSGYPDFSDRPYVLQAWKCDANEQKAIELMMEADVALFGGPETLKYEVMRAKSGKLTIDISERWLKRGWLNLLSPRLLKYFWYYHTVFAHHSVYKLCSSAFGCADQYKLHSFKNKCYKWGYFTEVDEKFQVEASEQDASTLESTPLMWCARFLKWKHPELPILLAKRLKEKGYKFTIDMFGSGEELEATKQLAKNFGVDDVVSFCGNVPNKQILQEMRKHEIFLFTSDKNEGWGAVSNEAMSNGCVLVGSDAIGSTPFLIDDGVNGCLFKSCDLDSLTDKITWLLDNPAKRLELRRNAFITMRDVWSPRNAALSLIQLVEDLLNGREVSVKEGPCSKAFPI